MALPLPATVVEMKKFSPVFDHSKDTGVDVFIQLATDQRKSVWATATAIKRGRSTRAAGLAPRGGSLHTLYAIGLIASLRSVNKGMVYKLTHGTRLPAVIVQVGDEAFAAGIRSLASGSNVDQFRAGRNFWNHLTKQLRRFKVTVEVLSEDDRRIGSLKSWAIGTVIDSREAADVPAVFQPDVVSMAG